MEEKIEIDMTAIDLGIETNDLLFINIPPYDHRIMWNIQCTVYQYSPYDHRIMWNIRYTVYQYCVIWSCDSLLPMAPNINISRDMRLIYNQHNPIWPSDSLKQAIFSLPKYPKVSSRQYISVLHDYVSLHITSIICAILY